MKNSDVQNKIRYLDENGNDIKYEDDKKIETIVFDGNKEDLFINFFNSHTSIYIFDTEIMFIDESTINTYTSSDVFDNVVYEGELRQVTHEEILDIFSEIILCFANADSIEVHSQEDDTLRNHKYFHAFKYIINVNNNHTEKNRYKIGNITRCANIN